MVLHSNILAWRIAWTEEPGGLQYTGPEKSRTRQSDLAHTQLNHEDGKMLADRWVLQRKADRCLRVYVGLDFQHRNLQLSHGSVQFSRSVVSDSLRPRESQHGMPPCPSSTPVVHSDLCPSSQ